MKGKMVSATQVCFTRKRQPTGHAKIECTHQTMMLQALLGQHWPAWRNRGHHHDSAAGFEQDWADGSTRGSTHLTHQAWRQL